MPASPNPDELDDVVAFIAAQQAHPDRRITHVGTGAAGILAELEGLEPPWATTARVLRDGTRITGAVVTEWDEDLGRAWIVGPWAAGDGDAWMAAAAALLDIALVGLPPTVDRHEMSGDIANHRLADLAATRGWTATAPNHILLADAGGVAGYAAGEVAHDGEGFIDFVAVDPACRGTGVGRQLVEAVTRRLLDRSTLGRVCLTVQDHRTPARALYARLGFRSDGSLVAYRSWT